MNKEALRRLIDQFWFAPADAFLRAHEVVLWSQLKLKKKVLDIGCGDGQIAKFVLEKHIPVDVGLDLDPADADQTHVYKKVVVGDATQLPFEDASFNTVVSNSTFEHIKNDIAAVQEAARVLKPGGTLLLTVPSHRLRKTLREIINNKQQWNQFNRRVAHYHYRTPTNWKKILADAGLKLKTEKYYLPPSSVAVWYRLFSLATWKPYRRELWSYVKDSPYGKLVPVPLAKALLRGFLEPHCNHLWSSQGTWLFLEAEKMQ